MFEWDDLKFFVAIAREGSTVAAAKVLAVSQPTVQRRLAALEEKLGEALFERRPTGYRLTQIGSDLLPYAERVEREVLAFTRQVSAQKKTPAGTIRITCPEADIDTLLVPVLDRFKAKYPGIRIEFIITDHSVDLAKGEADVALRGGAPSDQGLICRKIADCEWHLYASRSYVARHGAPESADDVAAHPVVVFAGPLAALSPGRWLQEVAARSPRGAYSNSVMGALTAVRSGAGLGLLPPHIARAVPELVRVLRPDPPVTEPFSMLVHPDLRHAPAIGAFFDFMAGEIKTMRALFNGEDR